MCPEILSHSPFLKYLIRLNVFIFVAGEAPELNMLERDAAKKGEP
jgi:hypothetical protein